MCGSRFYLNGRAAPAILFHLRHPLAGHLVGVISGANGDLILDAALTLQLLTAVTAEVKETAFCQPHSRVLQRRFL